MMRFPHLNCGKDFSFLIFGSKSMKSFLFSSFYLILSFDLSNFQFQKYFIDSIFRVCHYTKFSFLLNFMILDTLIVGGLQKLNMLCNFLNLHFTNKILFVLITSKIEDLEKSSSY